MEEQQASTQNSGPDKPQLYDRNTRGQVIFDVLVGAVVPAVLLVFDPIIFHNGFGCFGGPFLAQLQIFAYVAIFIGSLALLAWLAVGYSIDVTYAAITAGILRGGAFAAVGLGIVMLPFSLIGLFIVVGALGFFPFLTSIAYWRSGSRALRRASGSNLPKPMLTGLMLGGVLLAFGPAAFAQWQVSRIIDESVYAIAHTSDVGDDPAAVQRLRTLKLICLGQCNGQIATALSSQISSGNIPGRNVTKAYQALFGNDTPMFNCVSSNFD